MKGIRDNSEIGAVYIALPNSMHCEYTVRAAEPGSMCL
jgi:predicted dehydrogenase